MVSAVAILIISSTSKNPVLTGITMKRTIAIIKMEIKLSLKIKLIFFFLHS